jgi:hypothetical protein
MGASTSNASSPTVAVAAAAGCVEAWRAGVSVMVRAPMSRKYRMRYLGPVRKGNAKLTRSCWGTEAPRALPPLQVLGSGRTSALSAPHQAILASKTLPSGCAGVPEAAQLTPPKCNLSRPRTGPSTKGGKVISDCRIARRPFTLLPWLRGSGTLSFKFRGAEVELEA